MFENLLKKRSKYCCTWLQERVELPSNIGLNIRIVKIVDSYGCFVAPAFDQGDTGIAVMPLAYCPFCGTKLSKVIISDDYINEISDGFLLPPPQKSI